MTALTATCLLLTLAAREPLPIPGWAPPARAPVSAKSEPPSRDSALETAQPPPAPATLAPVVDESSSEPAPEARAATAEQPPVSSADPRRVAFTLGVGALLLSPSIELEVAPWDHVSLYVGGDFSAIRMGAGGQAGVRLRPMPGLFGPFLDVHLRLAHYAGFLALQPEVLELGSPGVMGGFTLRTDSGFVISAGLGVSLFARVTERRYVVTSRSTSYLPIPSVEVQSTTKVAPVPEFRLNVGWAL